MTYYGNGKSDWPLARLEQLRELAASGLSARQIGDKMGMTKNSILGKAHRNGIKMERAKGYPYPKGARSSRKKPLAAKIRLYDGWRAPQKGSTRAFRDPASILPPGQTDLPVTSPRLPSWVSIFVLEPNQCRWPCMGTGVDILYCGAEIAGDKLSFCPLHCSMAYKPRER